MAVIAIRQGLCSDVAYYLCKPLKRRFRGTVLVVNGNVPYRY